MRGGTGGHYTWPLTKHELDRLDQIILQIRWDWHFYFWGRRIIFKKQHSSEEKIQVPPNRVRPMTSPDVSGQETSRT